jgi:DNA-binding MarR family transcriptional regulator
MHEDIKESIKQYYESYFRINAIYERTAKLYGLTSTSLFVLEAIYQNQEQCTQRLICEKSMFPKQTVNTILNSFENKGYISKQTSPSDKRNKYILLTEAGQRFANTVISDMLHMEESAFQHMEAEERQAMLHGTRAFLNELTRILDSLEQSRAQLP